MQKFVHPYKCHYLYSNTCQDIKLFCDMVLSGALCFHYSMAIPPDRKDPAQVVHHVVQFDLQLL